jgi:hypothetical protein
MGLCTWFNVSKYCKVNVVDLDKIAMLSELILNVVWGHFMVD